MIEAWSGFNGGIWQSEINVRDFIQSNYKEYKGDDSFLAQATERTISVFDKVKALLTTFDLTEIASLFGRNEEAYNILNTTNLMDMVLNLVNGIINLVLPISENGNGYSGLLQGVGTGSLDNIDLKIKDMTASNSLEKLEADLTADLTAANFGKLSDIATKDDIALGIMNLVFETVGMVSIFAARSVGVKDIILTGNITRLSHCKRKFDEFNHLEVGHGLNFVIPERSRFATAIGAAMIGMRWGEK